MFSIETKNRRKVIIILFILSMVLMGTGCNIGEPQKNPPVREPIVEEPIIEEPPRIEEISIAAVGDIMVHSPQFNAAYIGGQEKYDFYPVFQPIEDYIQEADIGVANLETTFAGADKGYTGYPMFNSPEQLAKALKKTGFDILTTANNHSLDRRSEGVVSTIDFIKAQDLDYTGTALSQEERDKILIKEVKDISIAFMAYTYGTNGIPVPEDQPYLVNLLDKEQMEIDIQRAKDQGVDLIVVSMHFGNEYQRHPSPEQEEWVDFLLRQGVDVVLGSHPHVIQPMEIRNVTTVDGEEKEGFVIYSLGNFVSNQRDRYRDSGLILQLFFEKNFGTDETRLERVEYIPTWVDRSIIGGKTSYHILAIEDAISQYEAQENDKINSADYEILQRTWQDTTQHLEQENAKMVVKPLN